MTDVALAITLTGCNEVYGLDPTEPNEALEIARACPPLGTTVPRYSRQLFQVLPRPCYNYTIDENGRAVALCVENNTLQIEEGPANGVLAPANIARTVGQNFEDPALTPEGTQLVVRQFGTTPAVNRFSLYRREGDGWTWSVDLVDTMDYATSVGVPSRGPDRRVMHGSTTEFRELAETESGWVPISTLPWSALGVTYGNGLNLSPDGLRLVFLSQKKMMYAERATRAESFGIAREMDTVPELSASVFMNENCERIYFSGLSSVFYANQTPP